jgi:hypothetical protein
MSRSAAPGWKSIDGGTMTGTDVLRGTPTNMAHLQGVSYQVEWTGTAVGTLTFWVSNKEQPALATDADWTDITALIVPAVVSPAGTASATAGNVYVDIPGIGALWVRPKYVNASSTGALTITAFGKGQS